MKTPERTTAEAFPRYLGGEVLADSATLKWPRLIARLRKVEDYVRAHLGENISIETLAELTELSPFHFSTGAARSREKSARC
jgi:AraC-like DNA-binding protein